jgi:hypothetical protein
VSDFHPGDCNEGPPPQREAGATLDAADAAQLLANRESIRAAYETQDHKES